MLHGLGQQYCLVENKIGERKHIDGNGFSRKILPEIWKNKVIISLILDLIMAFMDILPRTLPLEIT